MGQVRAVNEIKERHCMKLRGFLLLLVLLFSISGVAQRHPGTLDPPAPPPVPNRVEVRFALGEKALLCHRFHLLAKADGQVLIKGAFSSGFQIPERAKHLPRESTVDVSISCGEHSWHFADAGYRAFLWGWWWVGTDYPPFQDYLRDPRFQDAVWIEYLIVDPSDESGYYLYHECPASLQNQKPGPCYPE